jgi:hypothetical protein
MKRRPRTTKKYAEQLMRIPELREYGALLRSSAAFGIRISVVTYHRDLKLDARASRAGPATSCQPDCVYVGT